MTDALTLLAEVRARGVELRAEDDGRLRFRPKGALDADLLARLSAHRQEIVALLSARHAEVAWRVAVLRPHVAPLGPLDPIRLPAVCAGVPALVSQDPATGDLRYHNHCASCGAPREPGQLFHCQACQLAHHLVLLELREGVTLRHSDMSSHEHQPKEPAA